MVTLSRITTGTGDDGLTHLADMSRVAKTAPRVEAVGAAAELNAVLGVARAQGLPPRIDAWAKRLQHELFDLGADLATPLRAAEVTPPDAVPAAPSPTSPRERHPSPRIGADAITAWERVIEELARELGPLRGFILPGGTPGAAHLHLAATVARRAERAAWRAAEADGTGQAGGLGHGALVYLNRLSDLLFQMARAAGGGQEELWERGRYMGSAWVGPASIHDNRPEDAPREMTSQ